MRLLSLVILTVLISLASTANAQYLTRPSATYIRHCPAWAQEMYAPTPNLQRVDQLYRQWRRENPTAKTFDTQYYKRWRRAAGLQAEAVGTGQTAPPLRGRANPNYRSGAGTAGTAASGNWIPLGPFQVFNEDSTLTDHQTNTYTLGVAPSDPNILYCGTETAEIYRSSDKGITWTCVSTGYDIGAVGAVAVHPTNPDIVYASTNNRLMRSTDGGQNWSIVYNANGFWANELMVHPADGQLVFAASDNGLIRSTDGGTTWNIILAAKAWDVKPKPGSTTHIYAATTSASEDEAVFWLSTDAGATFTAQTNGWYSSTDPDRYDGGVRLATTPANPDRVFAYLIGDSKPADAGFIGVFRSDDGGVTWTLPVGQVGGPYNGSTIKNLAGFSPLGTGFHQGFYNCAIMVSPTDADNLLVGGQNLWRSTDGGTTWVNQGGYVGGPIPIHVDMQDFRVVGNDTWITNDGGINYSTDFFATPGNVRMSGVRGSDFWGFGAGWNEDVMIGGLYHNGNVAYFQDYPAGDFRAIGGGEAPTGYVNPGDNRRVYCSDLGGRLLPSTIDGPLGYFGVSMFPNETYWPGESSEMEWHPDCYNIIYLGKENKLWRSEDGGSSFSLVHTFNGGVDDQLKYIEISRTNPQIMYVSQQFTNWDPGILWKTTDGGATWTALPTPQNQSRRMVTTLSLTNPDHIWIAYPDANNAPRVFQSTDGGQNWTDLTTATLGTHSPQSITNIAGTDGGVYLMTNRSVFYRNNQMADWEEFNNGLPTAFSSNIGRPFYRDGKLRIASYGKGIWESVLFEQPTAPYAQAMVNQLGIEQYCNTDTFRFDDYSVLNHSGASWNWSFENGTPATSTSRNPAVVWTQPGQYWAVLTVTDSSGQQSTDSLQITVAPYLLSPTLSEGYEGDFLPDRWYSEAESNSYAWTQATVGGFGNSTASAVFKNFDIDTQGNWADMRIGLDFTNALIPKLVFDVAYAPYGGQYMDTLQVLISTDCGEVFSTHYNRGGSQLATAPVFTASAFIPTATQWRTDTIDLSFLAGQPNVMLAIRNVGKWGQHIYVDNINLIDSTVVIATPQAQEAIAPRASLFPNPVSRNGSLQVATNLPESNFTLWVFDARGRTVAHHTGIDANQPTSIANWNLGAGTYFYRLEGTRHFFHGKIVVTP